MSDEKIFLDYFGLQRKNKSGDNLNYTCPFCGKHKLYINKENYKWDCKVCLKKGNKFTFIKEFYKNVCQVIPQEKLNKILKLKQVPIKYIKNSELKYNPSTKEVINPAKNNKGVLVDLRRYRIGSKNKFYSTKGFNNGLFFKSKIALKKAKRIFIVEGEWDYVILSNLFLLDEEIEIIGVSGCGVFKKEWAYLFKNKEAIICFDNDEAGKKGTERLAEILIDYNCEINFLKWKKRFKGFDIRDLFIKCYKNKIPTIKNIEAMISKFKIKSSEEEQKENLIQVLDGEHIPAETIKSIYKKWLCLEEDINIDLLFATIIANRLEGDPIWLFFVAPPGGAKTELILSVSTAPLTYTTTQLTPHSLVSGMPSTSRGGDPSLIPKLNNKVLLVKDFTTIMDMPAINRDEVFGILRDAYDGKTEKIFGNGITRKYNSKFGLIAGVTPAIDKFSDNHTSLGERFLKFRSRIPDNYGNNNNVIMKAVENAYEGNSMRMELQGIGQKALSFDYINKMKRPVIKDVFKNKIVVLAQCVSILRASVPRERWSNDIIYKPVPEIATRLAKQFIKLLMGLCYFRNKKASEEEYDIIVRSAGDSISSRTMTILKILLKAKAPVSTKTVSLKSSLPENTVKRVLQDLHILKCINRFHQGFKDEWDVSLKFLKMLKTSKLYYQLIKKEN